MKITCDGQIESGVVDYIELEHYGVLRVVGWSLKPAEALSVTLSQEGLEQSREPDSRYRTLRHDVVVSGAGHDPLVGFMYEFIGGFGNSEMVVTVDNFSRRIEASEVACLSRVVLITRRCFPQIRCCIARTFMVRGRLIQQLAKPTRRHNAIRVE